MTSSPTFTEISALSRVEQVKVAAVLLEPPHRQPRFIWCGKCDPAHLPPTRHLFSTGSEAMAEWGIGGVRLSVQRSAASYGQ